MKAAVGLAAALLLALTWLVLQSSDAEERRAQKALLILDEIGSVESALYRDVLRARAGMLRNYDPLVREIARLRSGIADLRDAATAPPEAKTVEDLARIVDTQEGLVERFKSQNALLQNSLASFGLLGARLGTPEKAPEVVRAVSGLSTAMLHLTLDTGTAVNELQERLQALKAREFPEPVGADIRALTRHADLLTTLVPAADGTLRALQAVRYDETAGVLRRLVAARQEMAEIAGVRARLLLYAISIALAALTVYLARGLQSQARVLRRRAELEHVIARNSTKLINSRPGDTADHVRRALAELVGRLGVERGYLVLRGGRSTVLHHWATSGDDLPAEWLERAMALASELPQTSGGVSCITVPSRPDGRTPLEAELAHNGLKGWICVPGTEGHRVSGILAFDAVSRSPALSASEVGSLRMAFNAMANALSRDELEAERTRLQANLQHTRRIETVGALASGVAHNFNNIVGAILGFAEMALGGVSPGTRAADHIREISRAAERGRDLIGQILTFGRRGEARREEIALATLLGDTKSLLDASLPAEVSLVLDDTTEGTAIPGDAVELQQVLMNLCSNAAQAMEEQGAVLIEASRRPLGERRQVATGALEPGNYAVISVTDHGKGMDGPTAERVFEPFFTTRKAGTGLGLATARAIVLDHGGGIDIDSAPGRGTRIEVWLPCGRQPFAASLRGAGQAVLILEPDCRRLLGNEELVAALGYEPVGFVAADDAIAACRRDPDRFDAALLCRVEAMPVMFRHATDLRAVSPHLPILATTRRSQGWEADQLAGAGIAEVLTDPIVSADLARALSRCLAPAPPIKPARLGASCH